MIGKRAEYGMRALINLGIAHELGNELVAVSTLAKADNLPLRFLEQIFAQLKEAGIIDTVRGKKGGYKICKPTKEIKMGDLVRLLHGPLAPISCASKTAYQKCSCKDEAHCGLRMLMIDVRNAVSQILDRYTLNDVVSITLRKIKREGAEHYFLCSNSPIPLIPENPADPALGFLSELNREAQTDSIV
jgi:Rrf2 family protein